ncbi:MAG TPA: tripartite tricarboxylate transporter substrate binding protein [Cytophagaceae bacterium]
MVCKSKLIAVILCIIILFTIAGCTQEAKYPSKPVNLVIGWAAGGITDKVIRSVAAIAEKDLGQPIVVTNMPGATSAVATQYVFSQKADGYTIYGSAENPALFQVLGLSERSIDDFDPIILLIQGVPVLLVNNDAPWSNIQEFINDLKVKGKEIKMAYTGVGGLPFTAFNMMKMALGVECTIVPFDGDAPSITALMGKQVDFTIATATAAQEYVRSGKLRALALFSKEKVKGFENVPLMQEVFPEMAKYLPWGSFYGIFVKKGTPQEIKDKLTEVFTKAVENPEWDKVVEELCAIKLNLKGEEATQFIKRWQSVTCWVLYEAGATAKSPAEFNIPKP